MIFIDGSNFLSEISRRYGLGFTENYRPPPESLLELAGTLIDRTVGPGSATFNLIRSYWFGSLQGGDDRIRATDQKLREMHYEPCLIKKPSDQREEKGVDLALGIEMLVNAFHGNYDIGILVAGDKDYIQLVREVKRFGQVIWGLFFNTKAIPELPLDDFRDIEQHTAKDEDKSLIENLVGKVKKDLESIKNTATAPVPGTDG